MDINLYIEVTDLSIVYPDISATTGQLLVIDQLSFSIPKGTFLSIVGPNGCGKTTLLLCLAGILKPSSGTVKIAGISPEKTTCGYVFQNYRESLFPWLTVIDNIAFPLWLDGYSRSQAQQVVNNLLAKLKINLPINRFPYTLSGGQQQLASILRAVIHSPAVLLLDEPLGSLDIVSRMELRDAIQRIWQAIGATTILVTHDLDEAILLADSVVAFTSLPAHIIDKIQVHFPHPRHQDVLQDDKFLGLRSRLQKAVMGKHQL